MQTRTRHLTAYLLKAHIKSYKDALREPEGLERYELRAGLSFSGALYIRPAQSRHPDWLEFILDGVAGDAIPLETLSQSAVLFVSIDDRILAFTFGYGRHLLRQSCYESDFGLKAALNSIDSSKLRSIDLKTLSEYPLHTRRQASRNAAIDVFDVDFNRDLLRAVTGMPRQMGIIARISGSDSVTVNAQVNFDGLGLLGKQLLALYHDETYKEHFGWIDHLRLVRDPEVIDELDHCLAEALRSGCLDRVHLTPPEPLEWDDIQGFRFSSDATHTTRSDLELEDYLRTISDLASLTVPDLKKHHVTAVNAEGEAIKRWSVYDCVVCEIQSDQFIHILSGRNWFRVDKDFAARIDRQVKEIPRWSTPLPTAHCGEKESDYNCRIASNSDFFVLLDKRCIQSDRWNSQVEVCDLLTRDGCFVHVKKNHSASARSHLFSQGLVSAEAFLCDRGFRRELRSMISGKFPELACRITDDRPNARDFEVVFALIDKNTKSMPVGLSFFSKVLLVQTVERLETFGYRVSFCHVTEADA